MHRFIYIFFDTQWIEAQKHRLNNGIAKNTSDTIGGIMTQTHHTQAAEHHENAAKSHRQAAEHSGKDDGAAREHSAKAHEHSTKAHEHSLEAHGPSQDQKAAVQAKK